MPDTTDMKHPTTLTSVHRPILPRPGNRFALFGGVFSEPAGPSPTIPTPWRLQRWTKPACRMVRMVLMKGHDAQGFVFYSHNREPERPRTRPQILRRFTYFSLENRCAGRSGSAAPCRPSPALKPTAYFATRPKQAQIGAWASKQSQPLESRFAFEQAIALVAAKYLIGEGPSAGVERAGVSPPCSSSSGTIVRSACTTASKIPPRPQTDQPWSKTPALSLKHDQGVLAFPKRSCPDNRPE